ncbi:MAG TPA: hypothetical protein VNA27_09640, partial [Rubrobacteraceae bacterium]|nr:hypothetical protein [Rubrobacteraceae bacterium]
PLRRERSWLRCMFSVGFSTAGIVIVIMVLIIGCAIIGVAIGINCVWPAARIPLHSFEMQHLPELHFSATLGQEPEIGLALV